MGIPRGLFLAVAGAASLSIACTIPWQESTNLDMSASPMGDTAITPTGRNGSDATATSTSRSGATPDGDAPAPELATLTPRMALGSWQKETPLQADRLVLAQQLQRELTRVGCYEGEISGIWTPASRRAMKAFMDRVNAALPSDEPDYILLTLVQGARDKVCGTACPAGQGLADGRCVPNAILAGKKAPQTARATPAAAEPARAITLRSALSTSPAPPLSGDMGRMGLAGLSPPKGPGVADARPSSAGPNAPGQPAPAAGAPRSTDAKRGQAQPLTFGVVIFKQLFGF